MRSLVLLGAGPSCDVETEIESGERPLTEYISVSRALNADILSVNSFVMSKNIKQRISDQSF
jgi:hypothetical protein